MILKSAFNQLTEIFDWWYFNAPNHPSVYIAVGGSLLVGAILFVNLVSRGKLDLRWMGSVTLISLFSGAAIWSFGGILTCLILLCSPILIMGGIGVLVQREIKIRKELKRARNTDPNFDPLHDHL